MAAIESNMSFHRYPYRNDYAIGSIAAEVTATHRAASASHYPGTTKGHAATRSWDQQDRGSPNHLAEPSPREERGKREVGGGGGKKINFKFAVMKNQ